MVRCTYPCLKKRLRLMKGDNDSMTRYIPDNSNGIIEAQLHERLEAVGKALDGVP